MAKSLADRLVEAASFASAARVQALLAKGGSPDAVDRSGTTALYAASLRSDAAIAQILLAAGADPNVESAGEHEGTPLCAAAAWGYSGVVAALLAHGANPDQREDQGEGDSPLAWASRNGHEATVRLLLDARADPNHRVWGKTPLLAAVERGTRGIVKLLLEHGADPELTDDDGRAPLQVAEEWADRDVETQLRGRAAPAPGEDIHCTRAPRPDGTEVVILEVRSPGGGSRIFEQETGNLEIAHVLSGGPDFGAPPRMDSSCRQSGPWPQETRGPEE